MQQVADRAGVSIATVSFVVNGTKRVSPQTAERVHKAMKELGFRNNVVARALASRRTRIIALLFPTAENRMRGSALEFFMAAVDRASELGYHLVLWPDAPSGDDLDDLISGGLVDGVILMEVRMEDPRIVKLRELGVPFAAIGRTRDTTDLPFVDMDFENTVEESLDYLQRLGHSHFGLVIEDLEKTVMAGYAPHLRTQATFVESTRRRRLTSTIQYCGYSTAGGREAAKQLLERDPDVTAILIMKDESTFGLMAGLRELGKRIPEDVSVLSLASSSAEGAHHEPAMSVMVSPSRELGQLAAESLIGQLEGTLAEMPHVLITCKLEVAESTGAAPVREEASSVLLSDPAPVAAPIEVAASAPVRRRRRTPSTTAGTTGP
ncbi:LacI family DNA-binding transcriptional regulator [Frondihabitans australicus]|nr:LacI family DNA-binding transcriptional regulator [Frondihabitans australicus]